jgi:L-fucose isomerase-like protein
MSRITFALFFGNRGFFPESLISVARDEMQTRLEALGYETLLFDAGATRSGAVESTEEGLRYAKFLDEHRGKFQGVILCLPNFGDETGAVAALRDAGVPILVHAYPDSLDKMGFSERRDAFCGKLSVMDVFHQYGVPFTALKPHVVHPTSAKFEENIHNFAQICLVVCGMRRLTVGAIGARTTAFKTVRFDEITLQKHGITCESLDLSEVIRRVRKWPNDGEPLRARYERLTGYTDCSGVPGDSMTTLAKLSLVLEEITKEYGLDCMAIRCWLELEQELNVAPCLLAGLLNDDGVPCACEVDVCNAVAMHALHLASQEAATCLDWNNNYGDEEDKCILFHCGPVPQSLMTTKGKVVDHPMFAKALGPGHGWGPNVGRIRPMPMTYASCKTADGRLTFYMGEGRITDDPIQEGFFGCGGVAEIAGLQGKLQRIGYGGYRHHVSITSGLHALAVREAFTRYLGYEVDDI